MFSSFNKPVFLLALYLSILFIALVPGTLITIPEGAPKMTSTIVHSIVFLVVIYLTYKPALNYIATV